MLISPAYLAGEPFPQADEKKDINIAKKLLAQHDDQLHEYHLSYCKGNFVAPSKVFLSYKEWTDMRLIEVVTKIKVPYSIIVGGEDHRFGVKLGNQLIKNSSKMFTIAGANHFFDSPYEFEFLDQFTREMVLH